MSEGFERDQVVVANCVCGKSFRAPGNFSGKKIRCPNCRQGVRFSVLEEVLLIEEEEPSKNLERPRKRGPKRTSKSRRRARGIRRKMRSRGESVAVKGAKAAGAFGLKVLSGCGGVILMCVIMSVVMFAKDGSLKSAGAKAIRARAYRSSAEKKAALWFAEQLHDRARNSAASELPTSSGRRRAPKMLSVSSSRYTYLLMQLVDAALNDAGALNEFAWEALDQDPSLASPSEILIIAKKSVSLTDISDSLNWAQRTDTLALAYFKVGMREKAESCQEDALAHLPNGQAMLRREMRARLRRYQGP